MADPTTTDELVKSTNRSVVLSVLMMVAGVLAICLPVLAHVAVAVVVGWLLVVSAILHLAYSWRASGDGAVLWEIMLAFVYRGGRRLPDREPRPRAGPPDAGAGDASGRGRHPRIRPRVPARHPDPSRGWLYLDGILTLLLAVLLWSTWPWPSAATWKLGVLVGTSMLLSGLTRLVISRAARQTVE